MARSRSPHAVLPPILLSAARHRSPGVAAHTFAMAQPLLAFTTSNQPSTRNCITAFKGWLALVPGAVWEWT